MIGQQRANRLCKWLAARMRIPNVLFNENWSLGMSVKSVLHDPRTAMIKVYTAFTERTTRFRNQMLLVRYISGFGRSRQMQPGICTVRNVTAKVQYKLAAPKIPLYEILVTILSSVRRYPHPSARPLKAALSS